MNLDKIKLKAPKMKPKHIDRAFFSACQNGSLDIIQYLFKSPDLYCQPNVYFDNSQGLLYACASGNLDLVKFLVSPNSINAPIENSFDKISLLDVACTHGHFEIVRYLLTDAQLIKSKKNANIHFNNDMALRCACKSISPNALGIVKYLLTSPELTEHASINIEPNVNIAKYEKDHIEHQSALTYACSVNNFKIVQYLLLSSDLKEHADIHHNDDYALISSFNHIISNVNYTNIESEQPFDIIKFLTTSTDLKENITANTRDDYLYFKARYNCNDFIEVMAFFITQCGLKKTETIELNMETYSSHLKEVREHLDYYFNQSLLHVSLNKNLPINRTSQPNKVKI